MAESRPTDEKCLNFAKALYNHIWMKFDIVHGIDDAAETEPADYSSDHFHLAIGRAVLSEQMLTRSFYKCFLFVSKRAFILKDTTTALTFCKILCDKTQNWDYFKRFFRFSALIAEFFLFRTERMTRLQLPRAPLVWNTIFKKYFADTFYTNGGWEGLLEYSQKYDDVYPPMEAIIEELVTPYQNVSFHQYIADMPLHVLVPLTDPATIDEEMTFVFRHFQLRFTTKKKPITPIEKHHEVDIPEDSETDSTESSSSSSMKEPLGFKSHALNRLLLQDAKKRTPKSGSKLDQPSCSTSELQDMSPSEEEHSQEDSTSEEHPKEDQGSEEQSQEHQTFGEHPKEDQGSDESLPSLASEGKDTKKRSQPMDTSGSEDPTQTKQRKLSDS